MLFQKAENDFRKLLDLNDEKSTRTGYGALSGATSSLKCNTRPYINEDVVRTEERQTGLDFRCKKPRGSFVMIPCKYILTTPMKNVCFPIFFQETHFFS